MLQVLLVEDDIDLATAVVDYLALEDIQCDHAANGVAGLSLIQSHAYQVIILDLNLPKMDGLKVCNEMRSEGNDTPVIMLTARDTLDDKVTGFGVGADDYLVKPFAMAELIVRLQALAKRRSGQVKKLHVADLELDLQLKQATRDGQPLKLSPIALKLLELLMRQSPAAVSRQALIQHVWGDEQPDSNALKVHIHNLRKQIDKPNQTELLTTVVGFGFALTDAKSCP
ncbi:response regulator transcription factor [Neiella holothuriorum]|nr:response regulator transcription factor [Neiella holothuriorum]